MSDVLTNTNLIAHEKALEAAGDAVTMVMRVPAPLNSIADQVIRSASSVPANLTEDCRCLGLLPLSLLPAPVADAVSQLQSLFTSPNSG